MRAWILQRYQVYARVCLLAALFLSPVIFWRKTADVFNLLKISILLVFGIAALVCLIAWSVERGVWAPRFRIAYAAGAFLVVCAFATALSQNPIVSLLGLYHRYGGLVPFLLYAGVMILIVALYWERPGDLREVARASAAASFLMMVYVLIQAAGLDWIDWKDSSGRAPSFPVGTMGNSNFAGGYLGIAVPFFLYVAVTAKRPALRTFLLVLVGLDLLALWFTQTRGGMIAGVAALTLMAFMYRDRLPRWVKLGAVSAVTTLAVIAVLALWHPGMDKPPAILAKAETLRTGTFEDRAFYWQTALRVFRDHPVLGTGLETYFANYPRYRLPADGAKLGLIITDKPHNIYFEYAANAGIMGIGSYLALVGLGLWYGYRRYRSLGEPARLLLVTFMAVLVGYLAQGFFSIDVPPLAVMGWVGLGGIAAIADPNVIAARKRMKDIVESAKRVAKKDKRGQRPAHVETYVARRGPAVWPVHLTLALAAAGLLALGTRPLLADIKSQSGIVKEATKASNDQIAAAYRQAISLFPLEPAYRTQIGALAEKQASEARDKSQKADFLGQALARYREALRFQPGNIFYIMNIARIYTTWGESVDADRFAVADRWWKRAITQDPTDWVVYNYYALMLNSWANATQGDVAIRLSSIEQLEKVVDIRPDYVPAWINLGKVYRALGEFEKARAALQRAVKIDPANKEAQSLLHAL